MVNATVACMQIKLDMKNLVQIAVIILSILRLNIVMLLYCGHRKTNN